MNCAGSVQNCAPLGVPHPPAPPHPLRGTLCPMHWCTLACFRRLKLLGQHVLFNFKDDEVPAEGVPCAPHMHALVSEGKITWPTRFV